MSQWLTSGRNRLRERQQQKQRFGNQTNKTIIDNNNQVVFIGNSDHPRGAVSSDLIISEKITPASSNSTHINTVSLQEGYQSQNNTFNRSSAMDAAGRMSFLNSLEGDQEQLLAARASVHQRINDVRSNMVHLNNLNNMTNVNNNKNNHVVVPGNALLQQFQNAQGLQQLQATSDLSHLLAQRRIDPANSINISGSLRGDGSSGNPLLTGNIANQNDFQRILALQENSFQHQIRRNQVAEELELIQRLSHQQAMINEMEIQKQQQQRAAAEQLLSQFAEVDQLVARQEMINQAQTQLGLGLVPNVCQLSSLNLVRENQLLTQRLMSTQANNMNNRLGPAEAEQLVDHSNTQLNLATLNSVINRGNLNLLGNHDILNHLSLSNAMHSLNPVANHIPSSSILNNNLAETHASSFINGTSQTKPNANLPTSVDLPHTTASNLTTTTMDKNEVPTIRYFNNGIEVQKNGKKKKNDDCPKKKKPSKVKKESTASIVLKKQKTLPMNKRKVKVAPLKKRRTFSSEEVTSTACDVPTTEANDDSANSRKKQIPGPHHDLMTEFFPSNTNELKEESKLNKAKMDAAAALLGFKTS